MPAIAGYYDLQLKRWVDPSLPRVDVGQSPPPPALPRMGQTAPIPFGNVPAYDLPPGPQGVYEGRWQIPVPLAKVNTSGTTRLTASVSARIENPSARLICSFSISFEPATPQPFSNYASAVWSATAKRPRRDGTEATLHSIFSGRSLPELWEISSAVRGIQIDATVTVPLTSGAAAIAGTWVLLAEWEPAMPMCDDEVKALYALCVARQILYTDPLAP